MPSHDAYFNDNWLGVATYSSWLKSVPSSRTKAYCIFCKKEFSVAAMGESSLKSHIKSKKHQSFSGSISTSLKMASFVTRKDTLTASSTSTSSNPITSVRPTSTPSQPTPSQPTPSQPVLSQPVLSQPSVLDKSVTEQVLRAEVVWVLKTVTSHYSFNSCGNIKSTLQLMFPGNQIANQFSCGPDKARYVSCYGLGPHFQSLLTKRLNESDGYVLLFDESLNEPMGKKQLDIHVRYWDGQRVSTRFYTSVFMGHATAKDLLEKIKEVMDGKLNCQKLLQLSMDGPAVNWKLHRLLNEEFTATVSPDFALIDIGSCSLHTVNNGFKDGHAATEWDLGSFFKSLSVLFHEVPARREDFENLTGTTTYPLDYCSHRWVENVSVAERALLIWPQVKIFLRHLLETKALKTRSFEHLVALMGDNLLEAKVEAFISIAKLLQPFLKKYQSEAPLVPFLAQDLFMLTQSLLQRFVTPETMKTIKTAYSLLKIDLKDKKILLPHSSVDPGFKSKQLLKTSKASGSELLDFKMKTREFLKAVCTKLVEKSPLKYKFLRNLQWLDPETLRLDPEAAIKQFEETMSCLVSLGKIKADDVDSFKASFTRWLAETNFPPFKASSERLDDYWLSLMTQTSHQDVWKVMRLILTLSHGQAQVERGFSVNKETMSQNMKERSAIYKRVICDHIASIGGLENVTITPSLLAAVTSSRAAYRQHLETTKEDEKKRNGKRQREEKVDQLADLKAKKLRLDKSAKDLEDSADKLAEKAEHLNSMKFIVESNALRCSAKAKRKEADAVNSAVEAAELELAAI